MNSNIKNIISALVLTGFSVTGAFAQQFITVSVDDFTTFEIAMMDMNGDGTWNINNNMTRARNNITDENLWTSNDDRFINFGTEASIEVNDVEYSEFPFITFSLDVTDSGAPSTFGFSFSTPITLASGPTLVESSIGGSITEGGSDIVTLTPNTTLLTSDVDGVNLGVDLGFSPESTTLTGPKTEFFGYSEPLQAGPVLASTSTLNANVNFTLTGGDDIATLSGRVDVDAVPEPSTYTLIAALGAASFVFFFRKRK